MCVCVFENMHEKLMTVVTFWTGEGMGRVGMTTRVRGRLCTVHLLLL